MYSMLESRERVFSVLHDIFGDSINLTTDNNAVITNISEWLGHYTEVDPHNLGILKMFFGMQTDFINTLDAYINCETYWGSDLPNTQVDFSDKLKEKVDAYILTLSGDPNTAAEALAAKALEDMWFAAPPRYDKVGDILTGELTPAKKVANCQLAVNAALAAYNGCAQTVCEKAQAAYDSALAAYNAVAENADPMSDAAIAALTARDAAQNALDTAKANLAIVNQTDENAGKTEQAALLASLQDAQNALKDAKAIYADFETNTSKSWVEFFCDRMDEYSSAEVIRVIVGYMMNRSADKKYRNEKTEYQDKKEDVIMDEISSQRMQAKAIAESKKNVKKIVSRNAKVSVAIKGRARASAVSGRRPSAIRSASRPAVRSAAGPAVRGAARTFVRHAAARTTPAHLAAGGAAKRVPSRIAGGQGIKRPAAAVGARAVAPVRPKAASPAPKPQAQAPKHDVKKVI
jgi:chemotaxis protein histidine kinase CheA